MIKVAERETDQVEYRDRSALSMAQVIVGRAWPAWDEIKASMAGATVEAPAV